MSERYKYYGPTMLLGEYDQIGLHKGSDVEAEVMNTNVATITKIYDTDGSTTVLNDAATDVAAKYLEPVKPESINFKSEIDKINADTVNFLADNINRIKRESVAWYAWLERLAELCYEHQYELNISHKTTGFVVVEVHTEKGQILLWETNKNVDENNVEVFKRSFEKMQEIVSKEPDTIRFGKGEYADNSNIEVGGQHYQTAIQPWDYIHANHLDFDSGNIVKYASRHKKKGGAEDVKKIISYAKHILKTQYGIDYGKDNE